MDEKSDGRAFYWFLDWQFTGSNDELTDPARYQYREAFALVETVFEGTPVNYCPFIFVDNDAAIARGWAQGFPKKLASVHQTRSFSAPSPAAAPLAKGSRFGASVSAHGERLATARLQLEEKVLDPSSVLNRPTVMRRYFPQLAANHRAKPPVDELTMSLTDDLAIVDVWAASAELRIPEVQGEDMHMIAPGALAGDIVSAWRTLSRTSAFLGITSTDGRRMTSRRFTKGLSDAIVAHRDRSGTKPG